jgi:hypothetical protein
MADQKAKLLINNISACGIIYRKKNPSQIFIEIKDDGHPLALVRRQLCPIGGNWIGTHAKSDRNPTWTYRREIAEELSFSHPIRDAAELTLLGYPGLDGKLFAPTKSNDVEVSLDDSKVLEHLKLLCGYSALPFGDYVNTVTLAAKQSADPNATGGDAVNLSSYFKVALEEDDWELLTGLQKKYGNLSNESITLITSLDEILESRQQIAFAHDAALRDFFLRQGLRQAVDMPHVEGTSGTFVGMPMGSYDKYKAIYEIAKMP